MNEMTHSPANAMYQIKCILFSQTPTHNFETMENDQSTNSLKKQQLNRYLSQMQTEVGRSGRTLHQIFSDYLRLKDENSELSQKVEDLEIPNCEQITLDLLNEQREFLKQFQIVRKKVMQEREDLADHPWQGFAHPNHRFEEFEPFLRTLRFAVIQLNKFWIEVQSFPLFLNVFNEASVQEIEDVFKWLLSNPTWSEKVHQPKVIPALSQPGSKKTLLEFVRNVKSLRVLHEKLASQRNSDSPSLQDPQTELALLSEGMRLVQKHILGSCYTVDLDTRIQESKNRLDRIHQIQSFFSLLESKTGFPKALRPLEVRHTFQAIECIRKIPESMLAWRQTQILAPAQMIRIQTWRDRARPILETRKRLETWFCLDEKIDAQKLRDVAAVLSTGGTFRTLKANYREAVNTYRSLARGSSGTKKGNSKSTGKESALQMSERLLEWAVYQDQARAFENNAEIKKMMGLHFNGIDTHFEQACLANEWAAQVRFDLGTEKTLLGDTLIQYILEASQESLSQLISLAQESEIEKYKELLRRPEFANDREFEELGLEEKVRFADLTRLKTVVEQSRIRSDVPLFSLEELRLATEETLFLIEQMDSNADLKAWLKGVYRGVDTDLTLIEQGMAYVQFIEAAQIPIALKTALLSAYGPQRFDENRALVAPTLHSLSSVQELFQRLEVASHGQIKFAAKIPVPEFLARVHRALKLPDLLVDWVDYLRAEREVRANGLAPVLDFLAKRVLLGEKMDTAYELGLNASLLRKAIEDTNETVAESSDPLIH